MTVDELSDMEPKTFMLSDNNSFLFLTIMAIIRLMYISIILNNRSCLPDAGAVVESETSHLVTFRNIEFFSYYCENFFKKC